MRRNGDDASPEEVGTAAHAIMRVVLRGLFVAEVFQRVGPENVAHRPESGRLLKSVDLKKQAARLNF